jgi:hypothetical protein
VTRRIIGAAFGEGGQDSVAVIVEDRESYHYAQVYLDGRVEMEKSPPFFKADYHGEGYDSGYFLAILGKFDPYVHKLREYIPFTGEWTISEADVENLFRWDREVRGQ